MKIYAVSLEPYIIAIGLRRVAAAARHAGYKVKSVYYLSNAFRTSLAGAWWKQRLGDSFSVNNMKDREPLIRLADAIGDADVVAFSLMSTQREMCRALCEEIKKRNAKVKIMIGGYHPTAFPEHAIAFADGICRGEGERIFPEFLRRVESGENLKGLKNTWVREGGEIIKNSMDSLLTPEEMEKMPFMEYTAEDQYLFSAVHGVLKPMEKKDYLLHVGTAYNTIWSVGCPYKCSFCTNEKAIEFNRGYAKQRGPSVNYIIREIKEAADHFPVDYVIFNDSDFLARDIEDLKEFARRFKNEIGLKIKTNGLNPVSVSEEKMKVLTEAGLVRTMMGFESGSRNTLELYRRSGGPEALRKAAAVLSKFKRKMAAPCFEIITDNPFETDKDLYETIDFLDSIPGPFTISLFGLCLMPGTALAEMCKSEETLKEHVDKEYLYSYTPTPPNLIISLFAVFKPPHFLVKMLKKWSRGREKKFYPRLKSILYKMMLVRRALDQARVGDFSTFPYQVMLMYHWLRRKKKRNGHGS